MLGQLASELEKASVAEGNGQTTTLMRVGAYRDEAGWEFGAIIRVSISTDPKKTLWSAEMDANSGWQWFDHDAILAGETYVPILYFIQVSNSHHQLKERNRVSSPWQGEG